MDFYKLITRFRQFGGLRLLEEYAKLGVVCTGIKAFFKCAVKRQSFKSIYPVILQRVEPFLVNKYKPLLRSRMEFYTEKEFGHLHPKIIWFCWLQGLEQAPEIVLACYNSLKTNLPDREIKLIDGRSWKDYIDLPEYVVHKWKKGRIPAANFSDMLRLELLIRYGGTWIDSTVLCTGFSTQITRETLVYLDSDLFFFQYTPPGSKDGISISNWFISSCTNNEVIMVLRDMLFAYWKDYCCTLDYYIFHLFFAMIVKAYPDRVTNMPYGSSQRSIALMRHLNDTFNQDQWDRLKSEVSFHKLSYRVPDKVKNNRNNYFNHIIYEANSQ